LALLLASLAVLTAAGPAYAGFPGANGKIAFVRTMPDNTGDIYTMNPDGNGQTNLTSNAWNDFDPTWSPDGRKMAFTTNRDGDHSSYAAYTMNPDGTSPARITDGRVSGWSPDGTRLLITDTADGDSEIYTVNADGTGRRRLTDNSFNDLKPVWSPDGRRIVFSSQRSTPEVAWTAATTCT
jgi:Tol biopolymer transport system component